ncbi:MAG: hypothetical protein LQ344_004243 [Seirophora lacunosa]|nr:MAG: hypothetical protein LQ344_004243 [Seirophora lacunosa]
MRSIIFLLALPLLSSARPQDKGSQNQDIQNQDTQNQDIQNQDTPNQDPQNQDTQNQNPQTQASTLPAPTLPTANSTSSTQPTPTLPPSLPASNFALNYASLYSAQLNNPLWSSLATASSPGGIPRASAASQENAYIAALSTTIASAVPQPAYIAALPPDQRAYMESYHSQVAAIADADFRGTTAVVAPPASTTMGGDNASATTTGGEVVTEAPPGDGEQQQPPVVAEPGPGAGNATAVAGLGAPGRPTGVYKMAAAAAMGVLGIAAFL